MLWRKLIFHAHCLAHCLALCLALCWTLIPSMALALDVEVKVSSVKLDFRHPPGHLMDGDPTTAWVGGGASSGKGQWIELSFGTPISPVRLGIYNGNQADGRFEEFRRIKAGRIIYPNGTEMPFELRDEPGEQIIALEPALVESFKLVIDDVYPFGNILGKMKVAVSELVLYVGPSLGSSSTGVAPAPDPTPPPDPAEGVPADIQGVIRRYYALHSSLDDEYPELFTEDKREAEGFRFEVFREYQRQKGIYRALRSAKVDSSKLVMDMDRHTEERAEIWVSGTYRIMIGEFERDLPENSLFILRRENGEWRIYDISGID